MNSNTSTPGIAVRYRVTLEEDVIGKGWETMFSNYTITEAPDHKS